MHPHRVVGGNRPVDKTVLLAGLVLLKQFFERLRLVP